MYASKKNILIIEVLKQFYTNLQIPTASYVVTATKSDIDNLMKLVEESMQAYKACKARVDAVQTALADTFKE